MREGSERKLAFDKVLPQPGFPVALGTVALPRKIEAMNGPWAFINVDFKCMKSHRHEFGEH